MGGRHRTSDRVTRDGQRARPASDARVDKLGEELRAARARIVELEEEQADLLQGLAASVRSERRLQALWRAPVDLLFVLDLEGNVLTANDPAAERFGVRPDELLGSCVWDRMSPSVVDGRRALADQVIRTGRSARMEDEHDGIWFDSAIFPIRDANGSVIELGVIASDISERKRAELALRESEERYRAVAENALAGIGISDENETLVYVNHSFAEMLGYQQDELVGKSLADLVDEEELTRFARFTALRKEGVRNRYETRLARKDGSIAHLEVSAAPMWDSNGTFIGTLAVLLDMTARIRAEEERRELEAQVQHAEKLKSLGVMAGGIAHDFNNLLASILGNSEIALSDLPPDSELRAPIDDILQAAQRAADLTKQMLAYSGKSRIATEEVDLSKLVGGLRALLQSIVAKKVVLELDLDDELPGIDVDPTQLRQVVMNLVANASEAITARSGKVVVSTSVERGDRGLRTRRDNAAGRSDALCVALTVSDTGTGMDADTRTRMFEPFFTTKFPGRGLGLASVHGIVRAHGGAIDVETTPGQGTVVRVCLPALAHAARTSPAPAPKADDWRGSGTVLIVDDEAVVRRAADRMVRRLGFASLTARDGAEALEIYEAYRDEVVLVLLDLAMPVMDGEEAFRKLRCIREDLPVLLSSGYGEDHAASRFAGQGLSGFIQKPYRLAALRAKIRDALGE